MKINNNIVFFVKFYDNSQGHVVVVVFVGGVLFVLCACRMSLLVNIRRFLLKLSLGAPMKIT